ncbi:hypothetical protein [Rhodothermus marinus]|uniref:hypothetical protein n=1 Tax=Rhodothermus marinus TaxID=29549 RepID=UPI001FB1CB9D|nr:hypothetical protein [Rhodothermus marinus]
MGTSVGWPSRPSSASSESAKKAQVFESGQQSQVGHQAQYQEGTACTSCGTPAHRQPAQVVDQRRGDDKQQVFDFPPGIKDVGGNQQQKPAKADGQAKVEPDHQRQKKQKVERIEQHPLASPGLEVFGKM